MDTPNLYIIGAEVRQATVGEVVAWLKAQDIVQYKEQISQDTVAYSFVLSGEEEWPLLADLRVVPDPTSLRRREATVADLIEVLEGLGAEQVQAGWGEDEEFGEDLWGVAVEAPGVYLVWRLPEPATLDHWKIEGLTDEEDEAFQAALDE